LKSNGGFTKQTENLNPKKIPTDPDNNIVRVIK